MASEEKKLAPSEAPGPDEQIIDAFDEDEENLSKDNKYLTFGIGEETYGISLLEVVEIIRLMQITPIPQAHSFIKGIINLRGKIIPIMDVRLRFGLEHKDYEERTCIIVVSVEDRLMGLVVDHVSEVLEIPDEKIETISVASASGSQRFVRGIGKMETGVKIILNTKELIVNFEEGTEKQAA